MIYHILGDLVNMYQSIGFTRIRSLPSNQSWHDHGKSAMFNHHEIFVLNTSCSDASDILVSV